LTKILKKQSIINDTENKKYLIMEFFL